MEVDQLSTYTVKMEVPKFTQRIIEWWNLDFKLDLSSSHFHITPQLPFSHLPNPRLASTPATKVSLGAALLQICKLSTQMPQEVSNLLLTSILHPPLSYLGDDSQAVRLVWREVGVEMISNDSNSPRFLPQLFLSLVLPLSSKRSNDAGDDVRGSLVIFIGHAAAHLPPTDVHFQKSLDYLLESLSTPSESVQQQSSLCLSLFPFHNFHSILILFFLFALTFVVFYSN